MTDQPTQALYKLKKKDGDVPLDGVEVFKLGLAWERIAQAGENSHIGKAKAWADRKKREANGETDPADLDAGAVFFTGPNPVKHLGFGDDDPLKDEATPAARVSASTTGDSINGAGDGDDETLRFVLADIPERFDRIMLLVGAFKPGSRMDATRGLKATTYDGTGGSDTPTAVIEKSLLDTHEMLAVADMKRIGSRWFLKVNGAGFTPVKGNIRSLLLKAMNVLGD